MVVVEGYQEAVPGTGWFGEWVRRGGQSGGGWVGVCLGVKGEIGMCGRLVGSLRLGVLMWVR